MDENKYNIYTIINKMLEECKKENLVLTFCPNCRRIQSTSATLKCDVCHSDIQIIDSVSYTKQ